MGEVELLEDVYDFIYSLKALDGEIEGKNLHDERYREVYGELMDGVTELSNEGLDVDVPLVEESVLSQDYDRAIEVLDSANPRYSAEVYDNPFGLGGPGS